MHLLVCSTFFYWEEVHLEQWYQWEEVHLNSDITECRCIWNSDITENANANARLKTFILTQIAFLYIVCYYFIRVSTRKTLKIKLPGTITRNLIRWVSMCPLYWFFKKNLIFYRNIFLITKRRTVTRKSGGESAALTVPSLVQKLYMLPLKGWSFRTITSLPDT